MTYAEFWEWWNDYSIAFPYVDSKLGSIEEKGNEGGKQTLRGWSKALADVALADAKRVTEMMVRGDIEPVDQFKLGETAAIVRRHAKELAYRKNSPAEGEKSWKLPAQAGGVISHLRLKPALETYLRMKAHGASAQEVTEALQRMIPPDPPDRQRRYRCLLCKDSGLAWVWSVKSMIAVVQKTIDDRANRSWCSIPCECPLGEPFLAPYKDGRRPYWSRRFNPSLDCPCEDVDSIAAINDLEEFVKHRLEGPARYVEFDEWNRLSQDSPD